jgi:uncharacterized protein
MKIWFDSMQLQPAVSTSSDYTGEFDNNDCDCPGDGGCDNAFYPDYPACDSSLQLQDAVQSIRKRVLQLAPLLYTQECSSGFWIICNPIDSGHIAVVDQLAFTLLDQFRTSARVVADILHTHVLPAEAVEKTAASLYSLGFLQDAYTTLHTHVREQSQTLSAWLHVTNACNLSCHYCYIHKTSEHMEDDTARRAVDAIFRSAVQHQYKRIQLKYAGGEASLQLNNVLAIHDYAIQQAQKYALTIYDHIISNGVSLTQQMINHLKERHIGVTISLDGIGTFHDVQRTFANGLGSFKYVDRTITRLLASGLVPSINVTVSQRNLTGLTHLVEYLLDRNLRFTFSYYRENDCSADLRDLQYTEECMIATMRAAFDLIEQRLPRWHLINSLLDKASLNIPHQHTCAVGRSYLVIDQQGGIAKCHADIKRTVTTIDADDPLQAIRDDRDGVQGLSVEEKEGCRTCQWRYWCAGGCPLLTHRFTGRYDIKSPNCHIYKALFPEVLRLEALRLLKYTSPIIF